MAQMRYCTHCQTNTPHKLGFWNWMFILVALLALFAFIPIVIIPLFFFDRKCKICETKNKNFIQIETM